jgi:hypothetical protein
MDEDAHVEMLTGNEARWDMTNEELERREYDISEVDGLLTDAAALLGAAADALQHSEDQVARLVLERLSQRVVNVQTHLRKGRGPHTHE